MIISFEQLQSLLQQQQRQFEESQMRLIESLTQKFNLNPSPSHTPTSTQETILNSITEFQFDPSNDLTFDRWIHKYEDVFKVELAQVEDSQKVRMLLRKLGPLEHDRYVNFILPRHPRDLNFKGTMEKLTLIFGEQSSLFNMRYKCLKP